MKPTVKTEILIKWELKVIWLQRLSPSQRIKRSLARQKQAASLSSHDAPAKHCSASPLPGREDRWTPLTLVSVGRREHQGPGAASCSAQGGPRTVSIQHSRRRGGRWRLPHPLSEPMETTQANYLKSQADFQVQGLISERSRCAIFQIQRTQRMLRIKRGSGLSQ